MNTKKERGELTRRKQSEHEPDTQVVRRAPSPQPLEQKERTVNSLYNKAKMLGQLRAEELRRKLFPYLAAAKSMGNTPEKATK